ncbi:hypothetical protein [Nocardia mexicana]|uniref:Phosphopantetheine adenylyltransferase n=1 Tax=Nocardia mexicana TaxID=279262 RepID=A0A370GZU2_9NOCA|nr:hypothetical protein [Nocardia mexicana]RDI49148.1 hypothetical protein DFR68_107276 [Nocardia mexicana]
MWIRRCGQGLLVLAGLINTVPGLGALSAQKAYAAYGISPTDPEVAVLLRHRAVLFAIVGIALVVGAFRPRLRAAAVGANAVSFAGFLAIVLAERPVNTELERVAMFDVVGAVALAAGIVLVRKGSDVEEVAK